MQHVLIFVFDVVVIVDVFLHVAFNVVIVVIVIDVDVHYYQQISQDIVDFCSDFVIDVVHNLNDLDFKQIHFQVKHVGRLWFNFK